MKPKLFALGIVATAGPGNNPPVNTADSVVPVNIRRGAINPLNAASMIKMEMPS
jgi:hypothetical protein